MRKAIFVFSKLVLGSVFAYAGIRKLLSLRDFAQIVFNYRILPDCAAVFIAYVLPWLEVVLGGFLIAGVFVRKSAIAVAFLLFAFMAALTIKLISGNLGACGCFDASAAVGRQGIANYLIRDFVLLFLAGIIFGNKTAGVSKGETARWEEFSREESLDVDANGRSRHGSNGRIGS